MLITSLDIPLRRLLKRREAAALLAEFGPLLPGGELALVDANGRFFAGHGEWGQAELQTATARIENNQIYHLPGLWLQPLLVNGRFAAAIIARPHPNTAEQPITTTLNCLRHSLTHILAQAIEKREIARETLDRYREINLLYHIGETIGGCLNLEEIPQLVLAETGPVVPADMGVVLLPAAPNQDELEIKASFGTDDAVHHLQTIACHLVEQVCASGQSAIVTAESLSQTEEVQNLGILLCAPFKTQAQVLGVLLLGRLAGQSDFTAGDEKLVMALTGQAAIAIETARLHQEEVKRQRLEEELAIGRQIQLSLLPRSCPDVPGWEFAAVYHSARQVGGDLYDFLLSPENPDHIGIVIADVTGKGVPAALLMALSRTAIRAEARNGRNPAAALEQANQFIVQDIRSRLFLSAFYATLDTKSGRFVYANGGHDWPLWWQASSGAVTPLTARGFVLGAFRNIKLEEREIQMAAGDLILFYTDGVTEARNETGGFFGDEQLQATVATHAHAGAPQLLEAITQAVAAFTNDTPQADDLTMVIVKRQS